MRKLTEYAIKLEEWELMGRIGKKPEPPVLKPKTEREQVKEEGRF